MNSNLTFDFTVDKANSTVNVRREFKAELELVWEAWTNPEILDHWWAPKPYKTVTKSMDFRDGGRWLYSMVSPKNEIQWCKADYHKIEPEKSFSYTDNFCDEQGNVGENFPDSTWTNVFSGNTDTTTVNITIQYKSLEMLEKVVGMGFKEGFTMAMQNLDQYMEAKFKLRQQNKTSNKARVSSYLNFDGKTEEAFLFYRSVFKTEFLGKGIERFGDIPADTGHPPVAEEIKKMVLHVELPITGNHILMGTDAPKEMGFTLTRGNNMHMCIEPETREEADRLFNELSEGGNVTMPMADMFFGAYFGEFSDKYNINWMINFQTR
ncbi:SRPBCC domain-containing protein [Daejeonella lutea]|uniref:PhnB protein n=1 Tax=Daejeonella lutea TaxID=572036 RepID=A0A1T5DBV2_9SPHI|nr:SRPBCC domain-containing protein [Daejeonella lutea]SKB69047.1 PhnB protein [Daejeonella lutea]